MVIRSNAQRLEKYKCHSYPQEWDEGGPGGLQAGQPHFYPCEDVRTPA